MKYIRTQDGIFKLACWFNNSGNKENEPYKIIGGLMINGQNHYFNFSMEEIIKQANTIEELGDAYVIVPKDKKYKPFIENTLSVFDDFEDVLRHNDIYLSIWVNALLKPVAKINEEGVLCLI